MRKFIGASLLGILLSCLSACNEEDVITNVPTSDSDSIYLLSNMIRLSFQQPELAIKRMDTCEMRGLRSADTLRFYRGSIYGLLREYDQMFAEWDKILFRQGADVGSPFYLHVLKSEASMKNNRNQKVKALELCLLGDSLAKMAGDNKVSIEFRVLAADIGNSRFVQKENIELLEQCLQDTKDYVNENRTLDTYLFMRDDLYDAYCRYNPFASKEDQKSDAFLYDYVCESKKLVDYMVEKFYDGQSNKSINYKYIGYYSQMVELLCKMGRKDEALAIYNTYGKPLCMEASSILHADVILAKMQSDLGLFDSSNAFFTRDLESSTSLEDTVNMISDLKTLCDSYVRQGNYENAYQMLDQYHKLYACQARKDLLGQSSEYLTLFKVQEHEMAQKEAESDAFISKVIAFIVSVVLLIGFCLLVILWRQYSTIKTMNRTLVGNINKFLDEKKLEDAIRAREVAIPVPKEKEDVHIVQRYIHELCSRRLFCNPDFNRDTLLEELKLPKNGFWKRFEDEIGQHFSSYLLNLRLEYAAEMIREHPELTVDAIALDSGFSGRSTFYRNFTSRFGISPKIYRGELGTD